MPAGSLPKNAAANATAPLGSTTSFTFSSKSHGGANFVLCHQQDVFYVLLQNRKRQSPGRRRAQTVRNRFGGRDRNPFTAPEGLPGIVREFRLDSKNPYPRAH
jgi:hypothetical protein